MIRFLKKKYAFKEDIITFEIKDQVTKKVISFYKDSSFPNYKDDDNKASILEKGNKNFFLIKIIE